METLSSPNASVGSSPKAKYRKHLVAQEKGINLINSR